MNGYSNKATVILLISHAPDNICNRRFIHILAFLSSPQEIEQDAQEKDRTEEKGRETEGSTEGPEEGQGEPTLG